MSKKEKLLASISFVLIGIDWIRIFIFSILGKNAFNLLFNYVQPLLLLIILIILCASLKGRYIFLFIFFCIITRLFANIPSNISRCENGKIEIQQISFTGAGVRYFVGEAPSGLEVFGWVKDDCGVPR
jgi:hypothetical protein